jgi:hypothetical protein
MIDTAGRTYPIRADGTKASNNEKRNNSRPLGYQIETRSRLTNKEKDKIRDDIKRKIKGDVPKAAHMRISEDEHLGTGGASSSAGVALHSASRECCTGDIDSKIPWKPPYDISDFYDNCRTDDNKCTSAGGSEDMGDLISNDSSWESDSEGSDTNKQAIAHMRQHVQPFG